MEAFPSWFGRCSARCSARPGGERPQALECGSLRVASVLLSPRAADLYAWALVLSEN